MGDLHHPFFPGYPLFPPPPPSVVNLGLGNYDGHRSTNTYDLNSKIMLTAIVSLSFVVVLVMVLHVYARCVLRRRARDRAVIRNLGVITDSYNHTGLDPAIFASLPTFVYKKTASSSGQENDASLIECAVCLSFLDDQETARLLPNCKHTFHAECIDKWLSSHTTCPICRTEAEPKIQPVQREGPAGGAPTAPVLERVNSSLVVSVEGMSENDQSHQSSSNNKRQASGSSMSRLSSFRRILSGERSPRRLQSDVQEQGLEDLERQ
ncbi:hypothetical protein JCGZ_12233 [Jatropha curcas]|uniref:RING-type E3 ubiquitin transferase n=1 Tax=Jatropha curcas TaxID=180498 RepID=A0A067K6Q9_JATCU|nr:E3 ubiquitin-protein ligase ATL41 [Jatropha curcas]KDP31772.1 hypothetical protein JCGZ_12233 [Jatropha curcas]